MIFSLQDKLGGQSGFTSELMYNADMLNDLKLSDIKWRGPTYTWTNFQQGDKRIWCKLDRILAHREWVHTFMNAEFVNLPPSISDHSVMVLLIISDLNHKGSRFRFINYWTQFYSMFTLVQNTWQATCCRGTPMFILIQKLYKVKCVLKQLASQMCAEKQAVMDKLLLQLE